MSGTSIVFISRRTLTMAVPGFGVYHLPRWRQSKTHCGLVIWDETNTSTLVPIRRDSAENIAQLCRHCDDWGYTDD